MGKEQKAVPFLENIGLFVTYRCQVACSHCIVRAGPHRSEEMTYSDAVDWISQVAAYGSGMIKSINFTGGEPLYDIQAFQRLVQFAASKGLFPTAVTNAHWATTPSEAVETLMSLPELLSFQISADEHHQERIPFERIENAVLAARELGLFYQVSVCTEDENCVRHKGFIRRLLRVTDKEHIQIVPTIPADDIFSKPSSINSAPPKGFPEGACGGAGTPVIFPDGSVKPCIGPVMHIRGDHPLALGNLRKQTLEEILDNAETNVVLHFVRIWGPARLLRWLEEMGNDAALCRSIQGDDMCSLCHSLFSQSMLYPALSALFKDKELVETTALARSKYLKEERMAVKLGLS